MSEKFNKKNFNELLQWLSTETTDGAEEYEHIRKVLIRIFISRGCFNAEDLADETIDRVASNLDDIRDNYQGEKIAYFVAYLRNIYKETFRKKEIQMQTMENNADPAQSYEFETDSEERQTREKQCLKKCLKDLELKDREIFIAYYKIKSEKKIRERKKIAKKYKLDPNVLRIQVFRTKQRLQKCIKHCLVSVTNL